MYVSFISKEFYKYIKNVRLEFFTYLVLCEDFEST